MGTLRYRFADRTDSASIVDASKDGGATWEATRYISLPEVGMAASTGAGSTILQLSNLHGDIASTLETGASAGISTYSESDEYGRGQPKDSRYSWLGTEQRSLDALGGLMLMGDRLYNPATGLFSSPDPVPGGSASSYGYPFDPVNVTDISGTLWGIDFVEKKKWYGSVVNPWDAGHHWWNYRGSKILIYLTNGARDVLASANPWKDAFANILIYIATAAGSRANGYAAVAIFSALQLQWAWIKHTAKKAKEAHRSMRITIYFPKILQLAFFIHPWIN